MEAASLEEAPVGRLAALAGAAGSVEGQVAGAGALAHAPAALPVQHVVGRAGRGGPGVAHTLTCVAVQVLVGGAGGCGAVNVATHTLAALHVQLLVRTAHICREYVCRERERGTAYFPKAAVTTSVMVLLNPDMP